MRYSYIARQPILDSRCKTIGYELLFRDGPKNCFPVIDADLATSRLLSEHFWTTPPNVKPLLEFVNFPYQSLIDRIPTLFPPHRIVIEVLEDCPPDQALLTAIQELKQLGYQIALDDFMPRKEWLAFFPYIDIIKIDLQSMPVEQARLFIKKHQKSHIQFLAERVENHQEFELAQHAGFQLFQGYFFSKPALVQRKTLEPAFLTVVQLCKAIAKSDIDYNELEQIISRDLTLSYKLLSFVNASVMVSAKIRSFKQALVYLGEIRLRKFIALVAVAAIHEDKPDELYGLSIQRARCCELLYLHAINEQQPGDAFLTGMFSLIDSLLDQPAEDILCQMPIEQAVKAAIISGTGKLGQLLALVKAYEQADWEQVHDMSQQLKLPESAICESYQQAMHWTKELFNHHQ